MATSSILNFFSLFTPSKQPPPPPKAAPPNNLSISSDDKRRDGYAPLVASSYNSNSSSDVMSVVCPSLAYTNTMYYKSGYNVQVEVEEEESDDYLLNRFRRDVMRTGVIQEVKRRRYFENKQEERKRRVRDAARRNRARRPFVRPPEVNVEDFSDDNDDDEDFEDDDDNWDLPEDLELPYGL